MECFNNCTLPPPEVGVTLQVNLLFGSFVSFAINVQNLGCVQNGNKGHSNGCQNYPVKGPQHLWQIRIVIRLVTNIFVDHPIEEECRHPDDTLGKHGECDKLGLIVVASDLPAKVGVNGADEHEEGVESMKRYGVSSNEVTLDNATTRWIHFCQERFSNHGGIGTPGGDDDKLNTNDDNYF